MYDDFLNQLILNGIVKKEDSEFIIYGLKQLTSNISFLTIQIVLYAIAKNLIGGIIFLTAFILLRRFAGGYHADTKLRCFLLSNLISVFYIIMSYSKIHLKTEITMMALSIFFLILLSPVDNINKRLDNIERKEYKKITISILFVEISLVFICYTFFTNMLYKSFLYSIVSAAIFVLLGFTKNKLKYNT